MRFLRRSLLQASSLMALLILAGCTSFPRTPYSLADAASAWVLDLRELRRYAHEPASNFLNEPRAKLTVGGRARSYLALWGGGADGADRGLRRSAAAGPQDRFFLIRDPVRHADNVQVRSHQSVRLSEL
jgi:hypothetical protein